MVLTNEKITVTLSMLAKENMLRGEDVGIPTDLSDLSKGLRWKNMWDLEDDEFDKIEDYFLNKQKQDYKNGAGLL